MSAGRIDHSAEAEAWLTASERADLTPAQTDMFSGVAQVHATLALVEQQRIANIIALSVPQDVGSAEIRIPSWDEKLQLRPEIAEGLGLS